MSLGWFFEAAFLVMPAGCYNRPDPYLNSTIVLYDIILTCQSVLPNMAMFTQGGKTSPRELRIALKKCLKIFHVSEISAYTKYR